MIRRLFLAALWPVLSSASAWADIAVIEVDAYPVFEMTMAASYDRNKEGAGDRFFRQSFFAGLIELVKQPQYFRLRLTPLTFETCKHQRHLRAVGVGSSDYIYATSKGLDLGLKRMWEDPSIWTLLSWRGKSDDPYSSGGFTMLLGQIVGNYGYRAADGSRYRACALTGALVYKNNEKHGRAIESLGGLIFSCAWDKPKNEKAWNFGLLKSCLAVGRDAGKNYGRFFWLPIGKAPPLLRRPPGTKEKTAPDKKSRPKNRKRVTI